MDILIGLFIFIVFIIAALKVGVVLKVVFTLIGAIIGFVVIMALIPLGIGLLLIPAIILSLIHI